MFVTAGIAKVRHTELSDILCIQYSKWVHIYSSLVTNVSIDVLYVSIPTHYAYIYIYTFKTSRNVIEDYS